MIYTNCVVKLISYNENKSSLFIQESESTEASSGTAFFVSKNLLISCYHCIHDSIKNYIMFDDNTKKYEVIVLKTIPTYDICLLKLKDKINKEYEYLEFSYKSLNLGDKIVVAGYPLKSENLKLVDGIISGYENLDYQISAPVNPGNSGGPLIYNNKVYGIVSYKIIESEGMSFCKAITYMKEWINYIYTSKLSTEVNIRIPELKIKFCNGHKKLFDYYNLKSKSGIIITETFDKYFKKGDILIAINNFTINNNSYIKELKMKVKDYITTLLFNTKVIFKIIRNKKEIIINYLIKNDNFKMIDFKYYGENFDMIEYKDFKFTKLTKNHLEDIISRNNFSNEEFQILRYLENYSDKEVWFISHISAHIEKDIIDNIKLYDIVVKLNNIKIKNKKDLEKAISNKTINSFILTKNKKIIFI